MEIDHIIIIQDTKVKWACFYAINDITGIAYYKVLTLNGHDTNSLIIKDTDIEDNASTKLWSSEDIVESGEWEDSNDDTISLDVTRRDCLVQNQLNTAIDQLLKLTDGIYYLTKNSNLETRDGLQGLWSKEATDPVLFNINEIFDTDISRYLV